MLTQKYEHFYRVNHKRTIYIFATRFDKRHISQMANKSAGGVAMA